MDNIDLVGKVVDYGDDYAIVEPLNKLNQPYLLSLKESDLYIKRDRFRNVKQRIYRTESTVKELGFFEMLRSVKCTKYRMGELKYQLTPTKISNVVFDFSDLKLSGDVIVSFTNNSTDNYEGYCYVKRLDYLLYGCPLYEDNYIWNSYPFDIASKWSHKLIETTTNTQIGQYVLDKLQSIKQNSGINISAHWEMNALSRDFLYQLYNIFVKGSIKTYNGFDVNINYKYPKGVNNTLKKHLDIQILLPIDGNINVQW